MNEDLAEAVQELELAAAELDQLDDLADDEE